MKLTEEQIRVGAVLRALRAKAKRSQEEVAREVGVALRTYAGWENDEGNPGLENLVGLHTFFRRFNPKLELADLLPAQARKG